MPARARLRFWILVGAVLALLPLVVWQWGQDEGGDVLLVLGPGALLLGASAGAAVWAVVREAGARRHSRWRDR